LLFSAWIRKSAVLLGCSGFLLGALASCQPAAISTAGPDLLETAAAQATALIQQAESTALLVRAGAQATALVKNASSPALPSALETKEPVPTAVSTQPARSPQPGSTVAAARPTDLDPDQVVIVNVGYAGEGSYIIVQFIAPPQITRNWTQMNVSVIDEATGTVYNEVPVAPIVGPLFARPIRAGQIGYVMLVNLPNPLPSGSLVTVILGDFKQEHLTIK
jgi:hypothetical protein